MKRRITLSMLIAATFLSGCVLFVDEAQRTPEERMEAFLYDANNQNWGYMWKHFHPDSTDYATISATTEDTFDGTDVADQHLPLGSLYVSGRTATCRSGTDPDTQFLFTVIEYEPDNYKIRYVEQTSTVIRKVE